MSTVHSNIQSFLNSVTPIIPTKPIPKSILHPAGKPIPEYFTLGDIWQCYDEWSAFGAGTPVVLNNGEDVLQFFVPYLSGIQIFINNNKSPATIRNPTNAVEFEVESWSDDSESDKLSRSLSNNSSKTWDAISADSSVDHEGLLPMKDGIGNIYFQYYDTCSPYWRTPLVDKIADFVKIYPGVATLKSTEVSPASWMAVAWYPIYHIPAKGTVKDLAASFLTFHTLSSHYQVNEEVSGKKSKGKGKGAFSLPPFGLATYRMQGDVWLNQQMSDYEKVMDLYSAADAWLKQLNVQHHDFNFFTLHSNLEKGMRL